MRPPPARARREVLLHGRRRPGVRPDVGGHVERRDRLETEASTLAPPEKTAPRPARTPPASVRSRSAPRRTRGTSPPPRAPRPRSAAATRSRRPNSRAPRLTSPPRPRRRRPLASRPPVPGRPSFLHHLSPATDLSPAVDEPLEPFVVVHERMRHRVEPFHGVLRPVEPDFDPAALHRHPVRQVRQLAGSSSRRAP